MNKGYAGNILRVDLSTGHISRVPTEIYSERFIGGRGIAAKIYWDEVPAGIDAFNQENRLIFSTGPVCGVPGFAGSRWQICSKSPIGNQFSYSNLGGSWGVQLKFAGYDGLVIHGKADKPVYLYIDDNNVELRDAGDLKGKGAIHTRERLKEDLGKKIRVIAIGPAGENMVSFATVLADADSSGSGGIGAVMGSKKLKAIAVSGQGKVEVSDLERIQELKKRVLKLKSRFNISAPLAPPDKLKKNICFGCINGCIRANYTAEDGTRGKFMCGSGGFSSMIGLDNSEDKDVPFKANKLCDDYGVDTYVIASMIFWLRRCNKANILTDEKSGLLFSKKRTVEFLENLLRKVSFREGFGDILANGTVKASEVVGDGSEKLHSDFMMKNGQFDFAGPRMYITTGLFYAMEPKTKMPIQHLSAINGPVTLWALREKGKSDNYMDSNLIRAIGKRFWGSELAADFSTYDGKALAAAKIQDREYTKESLMLCHFSWPIIYSDATDDHLGDPTLESQIYSSITGKSVDETGLSRIAERIFNMQRAVFIRDGHKGREDDSIEERNYNIPLRSEADNPDCIVPGKNGEVFSRKGMVVRKDEFENLKSEYYGIRGWDAATGLQKKAQLDELNLTDVAEELESKGLLAE